MLSALVPFHITKLTKSFIANIAFVRFLVRVNTHVNFQMTRCTKTLLAHDTFIRFLVRVNTLVVFQTIRMTKSLLAHIAFIRFLFRVLTHVDFQSIGITKSLLAHIALVLRSLSLHSFLIKSRFFFSYLLLLDFKNDFNLVRNLQTQHRFFFFHFFFCCSRIQTRHLQNCPRVHRALRMWILPSHVIIIISSSTGSSSACGACGVGSVCSPNEEIFVKTAVFLLGKNNRQFKDTKRERRRRRSCFNVEIKKAKSISPCLE